VGASANVWLVIRSGPVLFLFSLLALGAHLGLLLVIGRLLGFSRRDLLLASNANIGGEADDVMGDSPEASRDPADYSRTVNSLMFASMRLQVACG